MGLILLVLLMVADIVTTERNLTLGARELNPVARYLIERTGSAWSLVILKAPLLAVVVYLDHPVLTGVAVVAQAVPVVNNLLWWRKLGWK